MTISQYILVAADDVIGVFLMSEQYSIVCVCVCVCITSSLSIHLWMNSCFCVSSIVNGAALNIRVRVPF